MFMMISFRGLLLLLLLSREFFIFQIAGDHPRWPNGNESRHKDGSVLLPPQRRRSWENCARAGTTGGQPHPAGPPVILICDSLCSGYRAVGRTREAVDRPDLPGEGDHVSFVPDELERGRLVQTLHDHGKGAVPVDLGERAGVR